VIFFSGQYKRCTKVSGSKRE